MFVIDPLKNINTKNKPVFFDKKIDKKNYLIFKNGNFVSKNFKNKILKKNSIYLFGKE